jgi:hypothetical protein
MTYFTFDINIVLVIYKKKIQIEYNIFTIF